MKKAKIYSYSIVYITSEAFKDSLPYVVAILEDENKSRFPARLLGYHQDKEVAIGEQVEFSSDDSQWHIN